MDWKEIKNKYKRGFTKLVDEYDLDYYSRDIDFDGLYYEPIDYKNDFNLRDLYDFFDEQDIKINVFFMVYSFSWNIALAEEDFKENDKYETRKEAEEAAFDKAFEILEKKLKNNNIKG